MPFEIPLQGGVLELYKSFGQTRQNTARLFHQRTGMGLQHPIGHTRQSSNQPDDSALAFTV